APSAHWPEPVVVVEPKPDQGPVLVQIEYWIDPDQAQEFRHAMRDLRRVRRRDGAIRWGLFRDPAEPGRFVESFLVETWAEHLRQHVRATEADREIESRALGFPYPRWEARHYPPDRRACIRLRSNTASVKR